MNKFNTNNDLDFDFEEDDFGLLDSDESHRKNTATLENVEDNIREVEDRMKYSATFNDEDDDTP